MKPESGVTAQQGIRTSPAVRGGGCVRGGNTSPLIHEATNAGENEYLAPAMLNSSMATNDDVNTVLTHLKSCTSSPVSLMVSIEQHYLPTH